VLQFSENTAIDNKRIKDISSAPISKMKNEVHILIDDESIDLSALQDTVVWPIRISDSFRDFIVKRGTSRFQNSDIFLRTKVDDH
jgi:hypothetical protein